MDMRMRLILGSAACVAGAALALILTGTASSEALLSRVGYRTGNSSRPIQSTSASQTIPAAGAQPGRLPADVQPSDPRLGQQPAPVQQAGPSVFEQQARAQQGGGHIYAGPSVFEQQQRTKVPGPVRITAGPGPHPR